MISEFHTLEEQLKEFFSSEQKDAHSSQSVNFYKYNNLRIAMDHKKFSQPHFTVRVGISEATFSLENCEKISGGLGPDERFIYRWFERGNTRVLLTDLWKLNSKLPKVDIKELENRDW